PRPNDLSPHVTRVLQVEVVGEVVVETDDTGAETLVIKDPGSLGQTGKGVYEVPATQIPWLIGIPGSPDSGLDMGFVESGHGRVHFYLPIEALPRHIVVVGKSGVGKSYATGVIVEGLSNLQIPIFSFDVLGDMLNATEDLN